MSQVAAVMLVKDEIDVIEGVVRHTADEVDFLVVADNGSTDGTREMLEHLSGKLPLTVLDDGDPAYEQSRKMSALAEKAAGMGATWLAPVDADELWYSRAGRLREVLPGLPYPVALANLFHHLRTVVDEPDADPFRSMVWRQDRPARLPKVAFRWEAGAVIHQGNHGVTLPTGEPGGLQVLEVRHFPVRSPEQLVRKARNGAAAYAAAPGVEGGDHWKAWGQMTDGQLADAYWAHWHYLSPTDVGLTHEIGLVRDPAPYMRWRQK